MGSNPTNPNRFIRFEPIIRIKTKMYICFIRYLTL